MTIGENLETFAGKKVVDFKAGELPDLSTHILRVRWDWDGELAVVDQIAEILKAPECDQLTGLVIGSFCEEMYEESPAPILEVLIQAAPRLPSLTAFFLGDMTYEENEISWIYHTDVSPVWEAFPQLTHVGIRGSNGLVLGKMALPDLEYLVLQSGGMPSSVINEVLAAQLPSLKHLEIYLGSDYYGWDGNPDTVRPFLFENPFPQLEYLGLKNGQIMDAICEMLEGAPVLEQLKTLDLSLGTLGDGGADALLANPAIKKLQKLDLHRHYLSDEKVKALQGLGIEVDLSDAEGEHPADDRYVAHSE